MPAPVRLPIQLSQPPPPKWPRAHPSPPSAGSAAHGVLSQPWGAWPQSVAFAPPAGGSSVAFGLFLPLNASQFAAQQGQLEAGLAAVASESTGVAGLTAALALEGQQAAGLDLAATLTFPPGALAAAAQMAAGLAAAPQSALDLARASPVLFRGARVSSAGVALNGVALPQGGAGPALSPPPPPPLPPGSPVTSGTEALAARRLGGLEALAAGGWLGALLLLL